MDTAISERHSHQCLFAMQNVSGETVGWFDSTKRFLLFLNTSKKASLHKESGSGGGGLIGIGSSFKEQSFILILKSLVINQVDFAHEDPLLRLFVHIDPSDMACTRPPPKFPPGICPSQRKLICFCHSPFNMVNLQALHWFNISLINKATISLKLSLPLH